MKNPKPRSVDSLNISIGTDKCCVKIWQQISRRQFQSYSTASKCKKNRIALFWISTGLITLSTETYGLPFNNDAYKPSSNRMRVGFEKVIFGRALYDFSTSSIVNVNNNKQQF